MDAVLGREKQQAVDRDEVPRAGAAGEVSDHPRAGDDNRRPWTPSSAAKNTRPPVITILLP
jgi:hypothetical protein